MKYYFLACATNKKETGVLGPQCMVFPTGYNLQWYDQPNSMTKITNDKFPDNNPEFIFELDPKAKLTDFISQSIINARGFLISEKVKSILEKFALPQHKFYSAKVFYNGKPIQYYWLHLLDNLYSEIDYTSSKFYHGLTQGWKTSDVIVNSLDDIVILRKQMKLIYAESLVLQPILKIKDYDMLLFSLLHQDIFISKQIADYFTKEKITGYQVKEQEILN